MDTIIIIKLDVLSFCVLCTYYSLILSDPNARFGRFSWLVFVALIVETMIEIKFGWEVITIPIPTAAIIGWSTFVAIVTAWAIWKFTYPLKEFPIIRNLFKDKKKIN